jgi:transposase InsO family protein
MDQELAGQRSADIYIDTEHPASFSHPAKVLHYLRKEEGYEKTKLATVKKALASIDSYSRFKPLRNNYPKMTTRSDDCDERWQCDLFNVTPFGPGDNDGFKFLLIVIDVFSRRLFVVPLYDKSSKEVAAALELLFMTHGKIPKTITTDQGAEFTGRPFTDLCRKYSIRRYNTIPEVTHASLAERVIFTLRRKLGKFMLENKTTRFLDGIGDIVDSYNNSAHSTIGMTPAEAASSLANRQLALYHLQHKLNHPKRGKHVTRFKEGDEVQVPILPQRRFRKAHEPSFTADSFPVNSRFISDKNRPVARFVRDGDNILKKLFFYPTELSIKNDT